ncbi:MAG: hypothetical protein JWN69_1960 [Alphaproteobacteria bacterium]|nr:hypothetical protein [Alphaproteobacteria bacterium]
MPDGRISAIGAYLPLLRLDRRAAAAALRWSGLGGSHKGRRAVAGWDEDALTLGVEAARIAARGARVDDVIFASTSSPFFERAQAPLVIDALALPRSTRSIDVSGSRRCGVSALLRSLESGRETLVVSGERRPTKAGSSAQLAFGDAGAAVRCGSEGPVRLIGGASLSHDFVDVYASRDHPMPYQAEERFVREVATHEIIAPAIQDACAAAGVAPADLAGAAVAEPVAGSYTMLSKSLGMRAPNAATELAESAGDSGAVHPLFALALALHRATTGDKILLAGFGSGCDVLIFEVEGELPGAGSAAAALAQGAPLTDYIRFLSLAGSLDLDWGIRAEFEQKAQASVMERHGRDSVGFIGGRDGQGSVQFPKSRIPVTGGAPAPLADLRLADEPAQVASITADRLNFTPDPPFRFGLVQFDNGARLPMEYTDVEDDQLQVGDPLAMRFRIKALERRRGFRTYFWKAAPAVRPALEG